MTGSDATLPDGPLPDPGANAAPLPFLDVVGLPLSGEAAERYRSVRVLGQGSYGTVYEVFDQILERTIAIKVLTGNRRGEAGLRAFIAEARTTATLDHPHIAPVFDVQIAGDTAYFAMKRVEGEPLSRAAHRWRTGAALPALADVAGVVMVMIKVCDAVALAHAKGVRHRDIKPDNILLGAYGEVVLLDWGVASQSATAGRIVGTPGYMAPEQARGEGADATADIYALGATLFDVLVGRVPTAGLERPDWWQRRQRGDIDLPKPGEAERAPAPLLAIAQRALAADPAQRYPTVQAFAGDLHAFLAGQAIAAWPDSPWTKARRWHRRYGRQLWGALSVAAILVVFVGLLYGRRLQEIAHWGLPLVEERFTGSALPKGWIAARGSWEFRDGWAVSTGLQENILLCEQRFSGSVRIEYDCEMRSGAPPGDVSLVIGAELHHGSDGTVDGIADPLYALVATCENTACRLYGRGYQCLAVSDFRLEPDQRYRIRVELDGERFSLAIDDRVVCRTELERRDQGVYIGCYGFWPQRAFGNIRISAKGQPQLLRATAIGDAFLTGDHPDYARAAEHYRQVVEAHGDSELGDEARIGLGDAELHQGHHEAATLAWNAVTTARWLPIASSRMLDQRFANGDAVGALVGLPDLIALGTRGYREALHAWIRWLAVTSNQQFDIERTNTLLAQCPSEFQDDPLARMAHAHSLLVTDQLKNIPERFPEILPQAPLALLMLGRADELLARYPHPPHLRMQALLFCGRLAEVEAHGGLFAQTSAEALIWQNRAAEVLTRWPNRPDIAAIALLALDRPAEALALVHGDEPERLQALLKLGRATDIVASRAEYPSEWTSIARLANEDFVTLLADPTTSRRARHAGEIQRDLHAACSADRAALDRLASANVLDAGEMELAYDALILAPVVRWFAGDATGAQASLARNQERWRYAFIGRTSHAAAYLLGTISRDELERQPAQLSARFDAEFLTAVRADLAGDLTVAAQHYRQAMQLPVVSRGRTPDASLARVLAWRLAICLGAK